jgi:hypothetical protein
MVGVLLDPESEVVPSIRRALGGRTLATKLRLRPAANGAPFCQPSLLFTAADFDTEHERDPAASALGHIRVAHVFLSFGYPTTTRKTGSGQRGSVRRSRAALRCGASSATRP